MNDKQHKLSTWTIVRAVIQGIIAALAALGVASCATLMGG